MRCSLWIFYLLSLKRSAFTYVFGIVDARVSMSCCGQRFVDDWNYLTTGSFIVEQKLTTEPHHIRSRTLNTCPFWNTICIYSKSLGLWTIYSYYESPRNIIYYDVNQSHGSLCVLPQKCLKLMIIMKIWVINSRIPLYVLHVSYKKIKTTSFYGKIGLILYKPFIPVGSLKHFKSRFRNVAFIFASRVMKRFIFWIILLHHCCSLLYTVLIWLIVFKSKNFASVSRNKVRYQVW